MKLSNKLSFSDRAVLSETNNKFVERKLGTFLYGFLVTRSLLCLWRNWKYLSHLCSEVKELDFWLIMIFFPYYKQRICKNGSTKRNLKTDLYNVCILFHSRLSHKTSTRSLLKETPNGFKIHMRKATFVDTACVSTPA